MSYRYLRYITAMLLMLASTIVAETNDTHATAALFKDSETVFRTPSNLLSDSAIGGATSLVTEPFHYLVAGLDAIRAGARQNVLENSETVLLGAKGFHPPLGLGRVRSTWCYIAVLRDGNSLNLSGYFEKKIESAQAVEGVAVWHWTAKLQEFGEDDPRLSSLFAAQIKQSYVLVSNDLEKLVVLSKYLTSGNEDASLFTDVLDWNEIRQHEFWGYRKYRFDTSSEFSRIIGIAGVTSAARALIVFADPEKATGMLRLRSSNDEDKTAQNISATYSLPPMKSVSPGVWEAAFPLHDAGALAGSANSVL